MNPLILAGLAAGGLWFATRKKSSAAGITNPIAADTKITPLNPPETSVLKDANGKPIWETIKIATDDKGGAYYDLYASESAFSAGSPRIAVLKFVTYPGKGATLLGRGSNVSDTIFNGAMSQFSISKAT
jgi:hypothetical protein